MAIDDSQFPEAPETPAPLFAYRALKGFIFGSPNDENDDRNKENRIPEPQKDVLETKRSQIQVLTPQKRKRSGGLGDFVSSPVKSILRPTGVPTPRALHLQSRNVGVTFKDIRRSESPKAKGGKLGEGAMTRNTTGVTAAGTEDAAHAHKTTPLPQTKTDDLGPSLFIPRQKVKDATLSQLQQIGSSTTGLQPTVSTSTSVTPVEPFDLDAYMCSTEKEMKKLVRYGQKMREYAKKQGEENAELRKALQECRQENERLRKAEEKRIQRNADGTMEWISDAKKVPAHEAKLERPRKSFSPMTEQATTDETEAPAAQRRKGSQKNETLFDAGNVCQQQNVDDGKVAAGTDAKAETEIKLDPPLQQIRKPAILGGERQSSARLPPDRLAAARERIRKKMEMRKVSETSQMDWADL